LGVATAVLNEEPNPDQLISAADQALYEAKESGRNQVCVHGPQFLRGKGDVRAIADGEETDK